MPKSQRTNGCRMESISPKDPNIGRCLSGHCDIRKAAAENFGHLADAVDF
jgi:hypothetical protein